MFYEVECWIFSGFFLNKLSLRQDYSLLFCVYSMKEETLIDLLRKPADKTLNSAELELKHIYNATSSVMSIMLKLIYTRR